MAELTLPEDVEMPLEEHLVELGKRLLLIGAFAGIITLAAFPYSGAIIRFLREGILPPGTKIIAMSPLEYLYVRIEVSIVVAALLCIPLLVYELFAFMKPGLFPSERRFFLRVIPGSVIFLFLGGIFSYYVITPLITEGLLLYTERAAMPLLSLERFVSFVASMLLIFGIIFQMPMVVSLLVMADLIRLQDLTEKRKYAYAILLLGGVLFTPDRVAIAPFIVTFVLLVMYEISIIFAKAFLRS
ncbi:MAG: twin-arginine translocase subunit TatC [Candidatus Hydrothermarchaeales archaeon]